ncbi:MBL fold metallo-hydrolase [Priestia aryabhattai]|uniref:MBL fold metallo-hydrolase n=1 Tax=Priestia TaxID=2800373 RepID=UPI002079D266|nr:MBL fold metallo-hydrolase [Priestia megaterium]USL39620.1 MBL fold metallo-hydrolase [Priestia megaterium]
MSKEYFIVNKIDNGIFHIFDPAQVGCTLILGKEKALLFDTCYGIGDLKTTIRTITDLPITVVNSHGHIDHIGGNWQFDEAYIHSDDLSLAQQHSSQQIRKQFITSFKEQSVPPNFSVDKFIEREIMPLLPIKDGHIFDLGQRQLQVIHTPGHSQGCISLLDKKTGTLLSADIVMPMVWMFFPESTSIKTLVSSLRKLKDLSFDKIVSSHFQNTFPKNLIDKLILCANNIDVNKSKSYSIPFIDQEIQKGALIYAEGREPVVSSDYVAIIFNESKLQEDRT